MTPFHRRIIRACRQDRGAATLQVVLVTPLLMTLVLLVVQFALAWHAQHIAQTAASRALGAARTQHGSVTAGQETAHSTLRVVGDRVLQGPSVIVRRSATTASARVAGQVISVVPGLHLRVHGQAHGPVDRWTRPKE